MTIRVIWYLILLGLDTFCLICKIIYEIKSLKNLLLNIYFWTLILGFIYWGYMMLIEMASSGESNKATETLLGNSRTQFMTDTLFKYLFCIVVGIVIINYFFGQSRGNLSFHSIKEIIELYNFIYPLACIIELFIRERNRSPKPLKDVFFLLIILGICLLLDLGTGNLLSQLKKYILEAVGLILSYFLYDFLVYLKSQGGCSGYKPLGISSS